MDFLYICLFIDDELLKIMMVIEGGDDNLFF